MLTLEEGGKPENSEKNPRSKGENQQQIQPTLAPGPGIQPGTHWWEASAQTTAPTLFRQNLCIRKWNFIPFYLAFPIYLCSRATG